MNLKLAPLTHQPIRRKTKTNRYLVALMRFPALDAYLYVYLLRVLIGSLCCLRFSDVIGHCNCFGFGFTTDTQLKTALKSVFHISINACLRENIQKTRLDREL